MDLLAAYRAFVHVADRGSFTLGADAARIPQPVASRRIAALEAHFKRTLFDRTARRARLTPFGEDLLPAIRQLLDLADVVEVNAEQARSSPLTLAVPELCTDTDLATLVSVARREGLRLEPRAAGPAARERLVTTSGVRAAVVAIPEDHGATWMVELGVAGAEPPRHRAVALGTLRPQRAHRDSPRVLVQPEDDVPHVRDPLARAAAGAGLLPSQLAVEDSISSAVGATLASADLLLCSKSQAKQFGLHWSRLAGVTLARGYALHSPAPEDRQKILARLTDALGICLGVPLRPDDGGSSSR